jgi:hypothetical protein
LSKWVEHYRKEDPRRLYANGTGHTEREIPDPTEGTDYLAIQRIGSKMLRRESGWFGGDYGQSLADVNLPVIAHEVGQWVILTMASSKSSPAICGRIMRSSATR